MAFSSLFLLLLPREPRGYRGQGKEAGGQGSACAGNHPSSFLFPFWLKTSATHKRNTWLYPECDLPELEDETRNCLNYSELNHYSKLSQN